MMFALWKMCTPKPMERFVTAVRKWFCRPSGQATVDSQHKHWMEEQLLSGWNKEEIRLLEKIIKKEGWREQKLLRRWEDEDRRLLAKLEKINRKDAAKHGRNIVKEEKKENRETF